MVERDLNAPAPEAPPPDPLIGKVLMDRFRIVSRIGAGGMGTVYKAIQSPLDRVVALKVLNPDYGGGRDPGFVKRFELEASVTAKLRHPNTIHVIDYGTTADGVLFIAMEFLEGMTLSQLLTQVGALPWQRALHLGQQICRSLREAHKVGVVHRDLKPANVMILHEETDHDLVKVLDFGLVKSFLPDKPLDEPELTQAGVFLGSPQYVAPEQARNQVDPRSDIYSLGVILYQMLMGRPPFLAKESIDVIIQHLREPPPSFGSLRPELQVPPEIEAMVMKCLAKSPADRFQSMDELLEAMRRATLGVTGFSGVFTGVTPGPIPGGSAVFTRPLPNTDGDRTVALGPAEKAAAISQLQTAPNARVRWSLLAGGAFVVAVIAAAAIVVHTARTAPPPPKPTPVATPVATPPPAKPVQPVPQQPAPRPLPAAVRFHIASSPMGAQVLVSGEPIGETPLTFERMPGDDGIAHAELTFKLAGYETVTVDAAGQGPELRLTQKLRRRPAEHKKQHTPGYKDDPYQ